MILALVVGAIIVSCKKKDKETETTECTATFGATIKPIISSNCSTSGCHAAGSGNGPGALTSYSEIQAASSRIRSSVSSGSMPKNGSLSAADKNAIICWIDAGAQNN